MQLSNSWEYKFQEAAFWAHPVYWASKNACDVCKYRPIFAEQNLKSEILQEAMPIEHWTSYQRFGGQLACDFLVGAARRKEALARLGLLRV